MTARSHSTPPQVLRQPQADRGDQIDDGEIDGGGLEAGGARLEGRRRVVGAEDHRPVAEALGDPHERQHAHEPDEDEVPAHRPRRPDAPRASSPSASALSGRPGPARGRTMSTRLFGQAAIGAGLDAPGVERQRGDVACRGEAAVFAGARCATRQLPVPVRHGAAPHGLEVDLLSRAAPRSAAPTPRRRRPRPEPPAPAQPQGRLVAPPGARGDA